MAADTASNSGSVVPCPDPSAHQHDKGHDLSNAASTAALYATSHGKHGESKEEEPRKKDVLDADGKLSASSAATSLKYAKAQDLPSFPTTGIAAGSASKAALLAKDYKMQDLWEASASKDGHSAATLAMRSKGLGPEIYQGSSAEQKSKALLAATMSVNKGRQRAGSSPVPAQPAYPDSQNAVANALSAATASHRTSTMKSNDGWNSQANQAARIVNSKVDRGMYTSNIHFESEDDRHQAALKASAMTMAKSLYANQNRDAMLADPDGGAGEGAGLALSRNQASATSPDIKVEAMRYIQIQEAARKLAAERLAKIDKDGEAARFREYYGYGNEEKPKRLSRMSMRSSGGRSGRRRAASEGADSLDSDDEEQAARIRTQMSQLHTGVTTVDAKKQQADRARVMAAAEKRVSARLHDMDERVYADTGRVSQSMQEEWEAKARQRAEKEREERAEHPGKTHIGGGKFMDQAEIEAIAAARLKPTLDEISDNAEKRRARDEELRIEKQQQEKVKMEETMQKQQLKEEFKKIKDADKAVAQKEKEEAKARKEEEKRLAKEEKRKSRGDAIVVGTAGDDDDELDATDNDVERHRSVFARLKNRFSKSGAPGELATEQAEDTTKVTEPTTTTTATTPPTTTDNTGNVAGVAAGATIAEVVHSDEKTKESDPEKIDNGLSRDDTPPPMPISPVTIRETEPKPRASSEVSDSKWKPVSVSSTAAAEDIILGDAPAIAVVDTPEEQPLRPLFEQKPSLHGLHNDEADETGTRYSALERHISQIPESDDDDETATLDAQSKHVGSLGTENAQIVANRVTTSPVTDDPAATAKAPLPTSALTDETLSRLDEQRAEAPKDVTSTATTAPVAASAVATSSTAVPSSSSEQPEKKEKGVRGLLNKLRHRRGDSETSAVSTKSTTDASGLPDGAGALTIPPAGIKSTSKSPGIPEAAGARTIPPVDVGPRFSKADVDSSDDEEGRGRARSTKKLQKKMGFGNSRTTTPKAGDKAGDKAGEEPGRDSIATTDNETFEEARDHFDESLAPPPAFGGQAKTAEGGSPSRGTKFQEEL